MPLRAICPGRWEVEVACQTPTVSVHRQTEMWRSGPPSDAAAAASAPQLNPLRSFPPYSHTTNIYAIRGSDMVYSWDDKEAICYRLYVEERRSLEEVICYWEVRGFTPRYARTLRTCIYRSPYTYRHASFTTSPPLTTLL